MNRTLTVRQYLAVLCAMLMAFPPVSVAQQPVAPSPAPAQQQDYTAARLVTVWDALEPTLTGDRLEAFKRDDAQVKTPQDVIALFGKYLPNMAEVQADPKYAEPEALIAEDSQDNPLYRDYAVFTKWRTAPAGKRYEDFSDMRKDRGNVVKHIGEIRLLNGLAPREREIKASWIRRFNLAMDYSWPFALGLAKVDLPSPVWQQGSGRAGATTPGFIYRPKKGEQHKEVLRLYLLEEGMIVENGMDCGGNANVVQLKFTTFRTEAVAPQCRTLRADRTVIGSNAERVHLAAELDPRAQLTGIQWFVNGTKVPGDTVTNQLSGSELQDGANLVEFRAQARIRGEGDKLYELSCAVDVRKTSPSCSATTVITDGKRVTAAVAYTDPSKVVSVFRFLVNGTEVGESRKPELSFSVSGRPPGKYTVTVRGIDHGGNVVFECPGDGVSNVFVVAPPPPSCTLTDEIDKQNDRVVVTSHVTSSLPVSYRWLLNSAHMAQVDDYTVVAIPGPQLQRRGKHLLTLEVTDSQDRKVRCSAEWEQKGPSHTGRNIGIGALLIGGALIGLCVAGVICGGPEGIKNVPPGVRPSPPAR